MSLPAAIALNGRACFTITPIIEPILLKRPLTEEVGFEIPPTLTVCISPSFRSVTPLLRVRILS